MAEAQRFIIMDDHPAMLEGLKTILERDGDFLCAGSSSSAAAARELIRSARYDLMVTDIRFPDGSGFDLALQSRQAHPAARILFMSMYITFDYILRSFQSGGSGFIGKDSAASTLREAARALLKGHQFLDPTALREVIETITRSSSDSFIAEDEPYHLLTGRERELFRCMAEGMKTKAVAQEFGISPKTVLNHRQNILYKLRIKGDTDLTIYAERLGLLSPRERG